MSHGFSDFSAIYFFGIFGGFAFRNDRRQRISFFDILGLGCGEVVVVFSVTEADRKQSHQSEISSQRSTKIEI